jgi:hypothetical protein
MSAPLRIESITAPHEESVEPSPVTRALLIAEQQRLYAEFSDLNDLRALLRRKLKAIEILLEEISE